MKKKFKPVAIRCFLVLVSSCSNLLINKKTGNVSLNINKNALQTLITKDIQASRAILNSEELNLIVSITGDFTDSKIVALSRIYKSDDENINIEFSEIHIGKTIVIEVSIEYAENSAKLYAGK